ncbi:MAG: hypothetical protein CFE43_03295 [Burkholderiales bacterium PBB3]|nr:MAG: hypothetical protein CFE43_03295 [Burkholderiales bacterium PBB3]
MSRFFASLPPFAGWLVAIVLLVLLIVVVLRRPKEQQDDQQEEKRQFPWAAAKKEDFAPTVMVDGDEVTEWRAATMQDMPPPRPAGPIRVVSTSTLPTPLNESPGSSS